MTMNPSAVRDAFLRQDEACEKLGSPFTARICRLAGQRLHPGWAVADAILGWQGMPRRSAIPCRFGSAARCMRWL